MTMIFCLCRSKTHLHTLGAVARLQAVQEEERAQLHAVEAAAAKLQQSCDDVQSSRIMQNDLAESIASMQSLLKVTYFWRL